MKSGNLANLERGIMKREVLMWGIIVALIVGALIASAPKAEPMAIDFTNTASQRVTFSNSVGVLDQKSIFIWVDLDSFGDTSTGAYLLSRSDPSLPISWYTNFFTSTKMFSLSVAAGMGGGVWATNNDTVATGKHLYVATFDSTSIANDPIFYIDGAPVAVNELQAPTVPFSTELNHDFILGGFTTTKSPDARIMKSFVLPFIATADQVKKEWDSRGAGGLSKQAVFCPQLIGAKGLQAFDGTTLTADNLIVDPCSGSNGIPNGSPVGVGETYLSIK
ncbi:MAG: hypothetical protein CVU43_09740 [Chloroflexi bacterium HGW-Chloroflexi-5]|nr:MAG: hypothetical protein CVU43_09740 [Chloroflexi bacterium HGW-Chloroflexi-5]